MSEPEPVYSRGAADYQEAGSQQGLAYSPEAVYETTEAPGHYQGGRGSPASVPGEGCPLSSALHLICEHCLTSLLTNLPP